MLSFFGCLQVVLDTVELVLSAAEQSPAPTPVMSASTLQPSDSEATLSVGGEDETAAAAAAASGTGGSSGGSSWLGSTLQSMALRAGLNVTGGLGLACAAHALNFCLWKSMTVGEPPAASERCMPPSHRPYLSAVQLSNVVLKWVQVRMVNDEGLATGALALCM